MLKIRREDNLFLVFDSSLGMDLASFSSLENARIFVEEQEEGFVDRLNGEGEVDDYIHLADGFRKFPRQKLI